MFSCSEILSKDFTVISRRLLNQPLLPLQSKSVLKRNSMTLTRVWTCGVRWPCLLRPPCLQSSFFSVAELDGKLQENLWKKVLCKVNLANMPSKTEGFGLIALLALLTGTKDDPWENPTHSGQEEQKAASPCRLLLALRPGLSSVLKTFRGTIP